jgi:hypothetical protein
MSCISICTINILGRCLRPALYTHTAQALITGPVSVSIANAGTHPVFASPDISLSPLRGKRELNFFPFFHPLPHSGERVDQRSVFGLS